jgi:hypothetical protein
MPNGKEVKTAPLTRAQKFANILRICQTTITVAGGCITTLMMALEAERRYRDREARKPRRRIKKAKVISVKALPKQKRRRLKKGNNNHETKKRSTAITRAVKMPAS